MGRNAPTDTGPRIGELARAAGLTVRTLHYYDEIGLLMASARSGSGHRLYSDADVERLYRICLLRRLGLPLREIARVHARAVAAGAEIVMGLTGQEYGSREFAARDHAGNIWCFGTYRAGPK